MGAICLYPKWYKKKLLQNELIRNNLLDLQKALSNALSIQWSSIQLLNETINR